MRGSLLACFPAVVLFSTAPAPATAQVTTATIYGTVLDPSGAGIPSAAITAKNEQTAVSTSTTSNEAGEFTMAFVPVGTYAITVQSAGFKTRVDTGVELSAGQKVSLSIRLDIGAAAEAVTVTSEAPLLNTISAQDDNRLNTQQVRELPMARRDITGLLNLGKGVAADGQAISVNGLPPRGFTFTIDGVDASPDSEYPSLSLFNNYNFIKGVTIEAVQEVGVAKNIFSAEIANTVSGNVNLISKSGTNQFHGSLFEYYQSGGLNAVNHLSTLGTSAVYHQYGGSLGGPVLKDKLFFFGAFEGYRLNQNTPITTNVPSVQLRNRIIQAVPSAKPFFDQWQLPTEPERPGDIVGFFAGAGRERRSDDHGNARFDYNLSANNRLSGRYTRGHPYQIAPRTAMLSNWREFIGLNENIAATFTRVWSPSVTSEARFGRNRSTTERTDNAYLLGLVNLTGAGIGVPSVDGETLVKRGSVTSLEQSFSQVAGPHSIKYGGSLRWDRATRINEEIPIYTFSTLDDILRNQPSNGRYVFLLRDFVIQRWQGGVFVQDDIRVTPGLTVNIGTRYDYDAVPSERDDRFFNRRGPFGDYLPPDSPWNAYHAMFSPRVGFAWAPDKARRTSVRSGFGVFFIPHNMYGGPVETVLNGPKEPYEITSVSGAQLERLGIRYPFSNTQALPLIRQAFITSDSAIDANWENSYSMQWTLHIEREFASGLAADVGYVGTRGVKLTYSPNVNRVDPSTGLRENEQFGEFRYYQTADSSVYHALQASLRKRAGRGLQFNMYYTWASNLSYYRGDYNCCGAENGPQELNRLDLNRGPVSFQMRHRYLADFLYSTPNKLGPGHLRWLLGGWWLGGIFEARSGTPLAIVESVPNSPGARPDFIGKSHKDAVLAGWKEPVQPGGYYQYLNPSVFFNVPLTRFGTLVRPGNFGRNQIFGPGLWNVDLALSKNLQLAEKTRLQLRTDLFNALNHTVLSGMDLNTRSARFGRVTSVRPGRVMQLSMRLEF